MTKPHIPLPASFFLAEDGESLLESVPAGAVVATASMIEHGGLAHSQGLADRLFVILPASHGESLSPLLQAVVAAKAAGVILPAPVEARDIQRADGLLGVAEADAGFTVGRTAIIALAGDAATSANRLANLAGKSDRLAAIGGSGLRLAQSLGLEPDAAPVVAARGLVTLTAAAAKTGAIADVQAGLSDAAFEAACLRDRADGFTAKFVVTQAQAAIAQKVFGGS